MFTGKSVFSIKTKANAKAAEKPTTVTVDWTGLTEEQAKAAMICGQSPRVRLQGALRKHGIPAAITVKAVDLMSGRASIPITVDTVKANYDVLNTAEKAEFIKYAQQDAKVQKAA